MEDIKEKTLYKLGQVAYETHVGVSEMHPDNYFTLEISKWDELPASTKKHWGKIAKAIVKASWDIDRGDLED